MNPWLLITCGLPFSGKSTLATAVAASLGFVRVSVDDLVPGIDLTGEPEQKLWLDGYVRAIAKTERHLAIRESVIFDSVGHTRKNRYRLRRISDRHSAQFGIVCLDVERTEALSRLIRNQAAPTRPNVPIESFMSIADAFETPESDEPTITYRPTEDLTDWIESTLRPFVA